MSPLLPSPTPTGSTSASIDRIAQALASVLLCSVVAGCSESVPDPAESCEVWRIATVDLETRETTVGPPLDSGIRQLVQAGGETWALSENSWRLVDREGRLSGPLTRSLLSAQGVPSFADIDADGDLDMVLAGFQLWLFERAADSLVERTALDPGLAVQVRGNVVDVNDDGAPDALITVGGALSVAPGDGAFCFELPGNLTPGSYNEHGTDVADINGDGILDVVTVVSEIAAPVGERHETFVSVWLGQGAGVFAPPAYVPFDEVRTTAPLIDVDRDGTLDIVARRGSRLSHAAGGGDGTFGTARLITDQLVGDPEAGVIEPHDPDGDGLYELLLIDDGSLAIVAADGTIERVPVPFGRAEILAARLTPPSETTVRLALLEDNCPVD